MEFLRIFTRKKDPPAGDDDFNRGFRYVRLIIALQVLFIFGMVALFMVIGRIVATPWWVFLIMVGIAIGGCFWIWRTIRKQFARLKKTLSRIDRSDRNYEISVMGRLLTVRIEHPDTRLVEATPVRRALEAPDESGGTTLPEQEKKRNVG